MITFKEYLSEAIVKPWEETNVTTQEAIDLLNKYCKDGLKAIANGGVLYRALQTSSLGEFGILDSSTGLRTSRDTNNLYQVMMDASTALADYPKRSNSFICSTSRKSTENYGSSRSLIYVFVPFDGTKIAVCPTSDIFATEIESPIATDFLGTDSLGVKFTRWLIGLKMAKMSDKFNSIDPIDKKLAELSTDKLFNAMYNSLWCKFRLGNGNDKLHNLVKMLPKDKRMTGLASLILTPKNMGLKLIEFGNKMPQNKEAWFSGKAVAIRLDMFDKILKALEQNKVKESVNDKIFYTDFHKEKKILDGDYTLVATAGYVGYGSKPGFKSTQFRIVAKTSKGSEIGWVNFEKKDDSLEALDLSIQPEHRRKGVATEMYKFARELGNSIAPSKLQTGMGKQFWNKDHSK